MAPAVRSVASNALAAIAGAIRDTIRMRTPAGRGNDLHPWHENRQHKQGRSSCADLALLSARFGWYAHAVSAQKRVKTEPAANLDAVLVDIVRLAARNDAAAITRRVRRWVGSPTARRQGLSDTLRGEILAALQATPEQSERTRRTTALQRPVPPAAPQPAGAAPAAEPTLAPTARNTIARVIAEYDSHDALASRGLAPTRSLLLFGPPGVGKTMTAAWIAERLHLPLRPIEPSEIVAGLLGDSARNLTTALREAQQAPCVLLLDEIDAFGKSRDDPHDVGELKRLVTTLLVELDRWPPGKLIIGATNHPGLLDHALGRRFERHVALVPPGEQERAAIITSVLGKHDARISDGTLQTLLALTDGSTGSRLTAIVTAAVRNTILEEEPLKLALLREALPADPLSLPREAKASFAHAASERAGLPAGRSVSCSAARTPLSGACSTPPRPHRPRNGHPERRHPTPTPRARRRAASRARRADHQVAG